MKSRLLCAIVLVATAGERTSSQSPLDTPQAWGQSVDGLRIGISGARTRPSSDAAFILSLHNTSARDFVVNVGEMLANGKVMFPRAVRLALTDPAGLARELQFFDRRYPAVAGRIDDYTVALRAGAMYSFPVSLDQYWSQATNEFVLKLAPGRHRVSARFEGTGAISRNLDMQGVALLNFWKGIVESSIFEFEVTP
jgi:hypothetical protein